MRNEEHKLELVRLPIEDIYELCLLTARELFRKDKNENADSMIKKLSEIEINGVTLSVPRLIGKEYTIQGNNTDKIVKINGKNVFRDEFVTNLMTLRLEMIEYLLENGSKELFAGVRDLQSVESLVRKTMSVSKSM